MVLFLNIPLFIISFIKNGKFFFINAVTGTLFLSLFLNLFSNLKPLTNDRFLGCIYGGIIAGIGSAIILKAGASTGGSDLSAQLINSFNKNIRVSNTLVTIDIIVITLNVIFFRELEVGLYSAITIFLLGKMLDIFFEGIDFAKIVYIVSPEYEQISKEIGEKVKRGSTALRGIGMYRNKERNVLMCVLSRNEVRETRRIVNNIDKNAFIVITNAREVFGKGFKE